MTDATAPAGWYPDPMKVAARRYWNGSMWTAQTEPAASESPAPPAPPRPDNWAIGTGITLGLIAGGPDVGVF